MKSFKIYFTYRAGAFHAGRTLFMPGGSFFFMRNERFSCERVLYMPDGCFHAGRALYMPGDRFSSLASALHSRRPLFLPGDRFT